MVVARVDSVCRAGPGLEYPIAAGDMRAEEQAFIRWRDVTDTWFLVWLDRLKVSCWVSSGRNGTVDVFGDISKLPIYVPPTATNTPSVSPTPTQASGDAMVTGIVWEDSNNNQMVDGGESRFVDSSLRLWKDGCGNGAPWTAQTNVFGEYGIQNLAEGNYCLEVLISTLPTPANYWAGTTHPGGSLNFSLTDAGMQVMFGFYDVP
jgi:hypothetical protein